MELLYKADNIEVYFDKKSPGPHFYCNWIGYQSKEVLVHSGFVILDLLKRKSISKIINNNVAVTGPWNESSQFVADEWFPEMMKAGLKEFAWILSPDVFAELSAKKALPHLIRINIKLFQPTNKSYEDARTWLQSLPNSTILVPDKAIVDPSEGTPYRQRKF